MNDIDLESLTNDEHAYTVTITGPLKQKHKTSRWLRVAAMNFMNLKGTIYSFTRNETEKWKIPIETQITVRQTCAPVPEKDSSWVSMNYENSDGMHVETDIMPMEYLGDPSMLAPVQEIAMTPPDSITISERRDGLNGCKSCQ